MATAALPAEDRDEELLRAYPYRLLARFLSGLPDEASLCAAASLKGDGSDIGQALATLSRLAAATGIEAARQEYHELFIGLGRGELVPYASFYLTGFLNERPLSALRTDLAVLGVRRADANRDPEDHIGALCEVMAGLIGGEYGPADLDTQRRFFDRHLAPWASRFFTDLERARASRLYLPIGTLGRLFMDVEATAFAMLD
jgi:TorA maturation chaperone TorD